MGLVGSLRCERDVGFDSLNVWWKTMSPTEEKGSDHYLRRNDAVALQRWGRAHFLESGSAEQGFFCDAGRSKIEDPIKASLSLSGRKRVCRRRAGMGWVGAVTRSSDDDVYPLRGCLQHCTYIL